MTDYVSHSGDRFKENVCKEISYGGILKKNNKNKSKRSVRVLFSEIEVRIIPSRAELIEENVIQQLWYDSSMIAYFRRCAMKEVECFMALSGNFKIKDAYSLLYQPETASN
jgi:hypothetical protein